MTRYASTNFAVRPYILLVAACLTCNQWSSAQEIQRPVIGNASRYQNGVRNSTERPLNAKQLSGLAETLKQKSGFQELHFDNDGFLRLGNRDSILGGSSLARDLLVASIDRDKAIDLESYNRSSEIAFARLAPVISFLSNANGNRIEVYPLQIDFNDFGHLRGERAVIEAFDLGFVVLHELAHAALGLRDALVEGQEPGECEEFINRIRRELGVAERQHYTAQTRLFKSVASLQPLREAELLFAKPASDAKTKPQMLSLSWEAERVGIVKPADYKTQTVSRKPPLTIAP